ncbi:helix-turn-helix domain-containing protein [Flavobacterium sp. LaA7.5]|nr:helix-turn-helix domain-containing protein [Flavobacterium salilacus subsp. altitudinum]
MEIIIEKLLEIEALIKKQYFLSKEFLLLEEAAGYLGISSSAMYKLKGKNVIPFSQPGGKIIYFKRIDLDNWIFNNMNLSVEGITDEVDRSLNRNLKS